MKTWIGIILILGMLSCDNGEQFVDPPKWKTLNSEAYKGLADIEFHTNDYGVASGDFGTLLKTENGGESWTELNVGSTHSFLKTFIVNESEFFTSRLGLFKTDDGGNTFHELGDLNHYSGSIFAMHFFDSTFGIIYKQGLLLKTTDGGHSWEVAYNNAGYANMMQFVSSNIGYIAGGISYDGNSFGEFHRSLDGGNTWNEIPIETSEITAMYFLNEQVGYLSNFDNQFLTTQNGGEGWENIGSTPITFYDVVFLNSEVGYGIGYNAVYKTVNGGRSWEKDYEDNDLIFTSITKTPNGTLFTVSNNGLILRKQNR